MSKKICTFAADLDAKASRTCVRAQLIHELKRLTNMNREAQLIEPDWKTQPMRAWDDVYENLCREVGAAYGLNDIREA